MCVSLGCCFRGLGQSFGAVIGFRVYRVLVVGFREWAVGSALVDLVADGCRSRIGPHDYVGALNPTPQNGGPYPIEDIFDSDQNPKP